MMSLFHDIAVLFGVCAIGVSSCTYQNEETLFDPKVCNTDGVRYSVQVLDIVQRNCYQCHQQGSAAFNGIALGSHAALKSFALNGDLVQRINSRTSPMPPSGLLSECDRVVIEAWVLAGSPNN